MSVHPTHLFNFARLEVPDVKVAAAAREEDFGAGGWGEEGGCQGGRADVEGLEDGVRGGGGGGDVVEGEGGGGPRGEKERVVG